MDDKIARSISVLIYQKIGARMRSSNYSSEVRQGIAFWFENYNRSNGPIFSIRPSGLKRHIVSLKFGAYAAPCIEHIRAHATPEAYLLANALVAQLEQNYDVKINGSDITNCVVSLDFRLQVIRSYVNQHDSTHIRKTAELIMIPMIAAIAELIGYEDLTMPVNETIIEGVLSQSLIRKRERNPRNRLLCLSIHGELCDTCGLDPKAIYGSELGSILEVHHIEPLSEAKSPKAYDPKTDLIPLCPNCHRAIHKRKPAFTPIEMKELLEKS
jgi:5-methylcytosine-specific restriction protein A